MAKSKGFKSEFRKDPPLPSWKTERRVLTLSPTAHTSKPVVSFHPHGDRTYLWVGDDEGNFYGATEGVEALREFARELLAATEPKPKK
jgi:hypothetical protein